MDAERFRAIVDQYPSLRIAVLGDFCLDRYLEIDPSKAETSLETRLPVHNVISVRAQPGGAGTVLNNLAALGIGAIYPVGFVGDDGHGFELRQALGGLPGVRLDHFIKTDQRQTFTYCKPLVLAPDAAPEELNRLDFKNWTPTPAELQELLISHFLEAVKQVQAVVVLDQVALSETGVVTRGVLEAVKTATAANPGLVVLADSRGSLSSFPPVIFKMNAAELAVLLRAQKELTLEEIRASAAKLALRNEHHVFVTLAERGMIGAAPDGRVEWVPALPVRGSIDIVGAGDAVSANLVSALASKSTLREAMEMANAAASVVIHKLGTTGTANRAEIGRLLGTP